MLGLPKGSVVHRLTGYAASGNNLTTDGDGPGRGQERDHIGQLTGIHYPVGGVVRRDSGFHLFHRRNTLLPRPLLVLGSATLGTGGAGMN